jgi:hypothetical protein
MDDEPTTEPVEATPAAAAPDTSSHDAKIAELTAMLAERDLAVSTLTSELAVSKAANYDLLMAVPKDAPVDGETTDESDDSDDDPDIDDLFEDKE